MILAFAGSNSSTSINYKLVEFTASLVNGKKVQLLNMANYPFPLYSEDHEKEKGFSNSLIELRDDIKDSEGLILSLNEHNGNLSAYFKNLIDWLSRLERNFLEDKKILLMSASPGGRGATGALGIAEKILPRFGAEISATFSLPSFYKNFDENSGFTDQELSTTHQKALDEFLSHL